MDAVEMILLHLSSSNMYIDMVGGQRMKYSGFIEDAEALERLSWKSSRLYIECSPKSRFRWSIIPLEFNTHDQLQVPSGKC